MSNARVLVVDDDNGMRNALCDTLSAEGFDTIAAVDGRAALAELDRRPVDLVLTDVQMPNIDGKALMRAVRERHPQQAIIMMTAYGTIDEAVTSMLDGASHYLVKPFPIQTLLAEIKRLLPDSGSKTKPVAVDPAMQDVLALARQVAASDATVTLTGESGCGKEVIARFIHEHSNRSARDFVALNCAAIPDNMLEAVLFGHSKGAFTGASNDSPGKFELANHSTLLLDEITEMELGLQAKLLRVLQEREVERLGSHRSIALDVRVIATSNRDLQAEVAAGRFREDLFYRLNVFPVCIPPLRERTADILPLATRLLARHSHGRRPPQLSEDAARLLTTYHWPGNVRELDNVMQRSLILCCGQTLDAQHLGIAADPPVARTATSGPLQDTLMAGEVSAIRAALSRHSGRRTAAAADLGISPRTLRYKIAKLRAAGSWQDDSQSAAEASS
ncbi:MAG: sigma-54 dependent transcriptional regulator [Pseudomonadota bacterium]